VRLGPAAISPLVEDGNRLLRIALLALNNSSRKTNSPSGSMPVMLVATVPSRSRARSTGPKISLGSEKRVSMYSKYRPRTAMLNAG